MVSCTRMTGGRTGRLGSGHERLRAGGPQLEREPERGYGLLLYGTCGSCALTRFSRNHAYAIRYDYFWATPHKTAASASSRTYTTTHTSDSRLTPHTSYLAYQAS
jgi:hypothetical protein